MGCDRSSHNKTQTRDNGDVMLLRLRIAAFGWLSVDIFGEWRNNNTTHDDEKWLKPEMRSPQLNTRWSSSIVVAISKSDFSSAAAAAVAASSLR